MVEGSLLKILRLCSISVLVGAAGCAGPVALTVAINPADEAAYEAALSHAHQDGRQAFAHWMAAERGLDASEVLASDVDLSSKRNPFDAYRNDQAVSRGAVIFKVHCARCHGEDARGGGPAVLGDYPAGDFKTFGKRLTATLHRGAPRKWFRVIHDGEGDRVVYPDGETLAMPPFGDALTREQIWLVITYLQSLDVHAPKRGYER